MENLPLAEVIPWFGKWAVARMRGQAALIETSGFATKEAAQNYTNELNKS